MDKIDNSARCNTRPFKRHPWCRERLPVGDTGPSMTQQSHLDQTDVNQIIARFDRTGQLPVQDRQPQYGDCTHLQGDLTEMIAKARRDIDTMEEFAKGWTPATPETENPPEAKIEPPSPPVA